MKQVSIFPTWECQLSCDYCSIRNSRIDRSVQPVHWKEWAGRFPAFCRVGASWTSRAASRCCTRAIDLLFELNRNGLRWAITSNLKNTWRLRRWWQTACRMRLHQCQRPQGQPRGHAQQRAPPQRGLSVNVHRVDHPAAASTRTTRNSSPTRTGGGNRAVDGIHRWCTAGKDHWIANPAGDLWRCIVAAETGQPPIGNLFTGKTQPTGPLCDFGCTTCYTENPGAWHVEMRDAQEHMHLLINLLWRCGLSCPYCLLPHIKINREAQEHSWQEWTQALLDTTPPGSIYDFGGGDPLLFPGLARMADVLARNGRIWAVTTSAVEKSGVDEFMHVRPLGCACFNISDHPGNYDAADNISRLQTVFPVVFNRVDSPAGRPPSRRHSRSDTVSDLAREGDRPGRHQALVQLWHPPLGARPGRRRVPLQPGDGHGTEAAREPVQAGHRDT